MEINLTVDQEKIRLDQFLNGKLSKISRSKIQSSIRSGEITLNGESVKPGIMLKGGEEITGDIASPTIEHLVKQKMELDILYEDDAIAVINKSAGLVVHPGSGNIDGTLVNGLIYHFNTLSEINQTRPGIVHRLDKDTSGVIVIAKTDQAHANLAEQFEKRTVEKYYTAIVWGKSPERGTIEGLINRHKTNRVKFAINTTSGRNSKTLYKRENYSPPFSVVKMKPETGRTHQLRVHLSYIGHPITGDDLYGGGSKKIKSYHSRYTSLCKRVLKTLGRTALHAHSLKLHHPVTSELKRWSAPLPNDMITTISILKENIGNE